MADCVACAYPMVQVAKGQRVGFHFEDDLEAKKVIEKHDIKMKEEDASVGCYVCPECGHCVWLEE